MSVDLCFWMGVVGCACILVAFVLNQFEVWKNTDRKYDLTNFVGSGLLFIYAWVGGVVPFVVLNGVWAAVSLKDLFTKNKNFPRKHLVERNKDF